MNQIVVAVFEGQSSADAAVQEGQNPLGCHNSPVHMRRPSREYSCNMGRSRPAHGHGHLQLFLPTFRSWPVDRSNFGALIRKPEWQARVAQRGLQPQPLPGRVMGLRRVI